MYATLQQTTYSEAKTVEQQPEEKVIRILKEVKDMSQNFPQNTKHMWKEQKQYNNNIPKQRRWENDHTSTMDSRTKQFGTTMDSRTKQSASL